MVDKETAPKRAMSDGHKAALAAGREEGRAVRCCLEALGRGITYAAWRQAGVSASVLKQAGITRCM